MQARKLNFVHNFTLAFEFQAFSLNLFHNILILHTREERRTNAWLNSPDGLICAEILFQKIKSFLVIRPGFPPSKVATGTYGQNSGASLKVILIGLEFKTLFVNVPVSCFLCTGTIPVNKPFLYFVCKRDNSYFFTCINLPRSCN